MFLINIILLNYFFLFGREGMIYYIIFFIIISYFVRTILYYILSIGIYSYFVWAFNMFTIGMDIDNTVISIISIPILFSELLMNSYDSFNHYTIHISFFY